MESCTIEFKGTRNLSDSIWTFETENGAIESGNTNCRVYFRAVLATLCGLGTLACGLGNFKVSSTQWRIQANIWQGLYIPILGVVGVTGVVSMKVGSMRCCC